MLKDERMTSTKSGGLCECFKLNCGFHFASFMKKYPTYIYIYIYI
jgi:hypothetical protein